MLERPRLRRSRSRASVWENWDTPSIIVASVYCDAHSPQCQGGFLPSPLMPNNPAFWVQPCVVFTGSEWQNHGARRFGLAAPRAASSKGETRVAVQPLDDAGLKCLDFGLCTRQAVVMLQKARAFIETRSPVLSGPIAST
jgi:hypothetical protein